MPGTSCGSARPRRTTGSWQCARPARSTKMAGASPGRSKPINDAAHPAEVLGKGAAARLLIGRQAGALGEEADGASGIVEQHAVPLDRAVDGRLVDLQRRFQG